MAQILCKLDLDVVNIAPGQAVMAKAGDFASRFLQIRLHAAGVPLSFNEGDGVLLNVRRPDGSTASFEGHVNGDGTLTVPLSGWTLEQTGELACDVSVVDDAGSRLTGATFAVLVEEAICPDGEPGDGGESVTAAFLMASKLAQVDHYINSEQVVVLPKYGCNYQLDLSPAKYRKNGAWIPIRVSLPVPEQESNARGILLRVYAPQKETGTAPTFVLKNLMLEGGYFPPVGDFFDMEFGYVPKASKWQLSVHPFSLEGGLPRPLALGETADTAFRGDYGAAAYAHSIAKGNPHGVTLEQLGGVDAAYVDEKLAEVQSTVNEALGTVNAALADILGV